MSIVTSPAALTLPADWAPPAAPDARRLIVVQPEPLNAESPMHEQIGLTTPTPLFYIRNHFAVPHLSADDWRLTIDGPVTRSLTLTFDDLRSFRSRSLLATLECAGNGRSGLWPRADGEPWHYGAVSTAEWTGVPLGVVLEAAGLSPDTQHIAVEGADRGVVSLRGGVVPYARGLELRKALDANTLLAYAMNGAPLTAEHGYPVRLLVPGWYGMASVKWVTRITALTDSFRGYFQTERYILLREGHQEAPREPLTTMRVRSLITTPSAGATLPRGQHLVRGLAWSGAAPVTRVEVSTDDGASWGHAEFASEAAPYAWRRWEYVWSATEPGPATLRSRAYDKSAQAQPLEPEWNRLGYANNTVAAVGVIVH